jgi:hypothetical protein
LSKPPGPPSRKSELRHQNGVAALEPLEQQGELGAVDTGAARRLMENLGSEMAGV